MTQNGFVFRLIAALLLIGLMVGGGYAVYRMGVAQGTAQAPEVAQAIQQAGEDGQPVPPMYGYGYPYAWGYRPHFGFFPFFGCVGAFLFIVFFFGLLRFVFRPWGWGRHGYWGKRWEGGAPPMFYEWHKHAHEEKPEEKQ